MTHFRLTWPEVVRIGRYSLEFSFAEPALKRRLLESYDRRIDAFQKRFDVPRWRRELRSIRPAVSGYAFRHLRVSRRDMIAPSN